MRTTVFKTRQTITRIGPSYAGIQTPAPFQYYNATARTPGPGLTALSRKFWHDETELPEMNAMKKIKTYVFNAYGALLDTYLPFEKYRDELGENALIIYKLWRSKRLQYSSQLSLMNQYTSYDKIQKYALDFACEVYGVRDDGIKKKILKAHSELACYSDVKDVLTSLKNAGLQTAVLSNGTPQKLNSTLKHAGISEVLDGVYSTEQVRAYKPSPAVYEFVGEQLGLARNKICFVSSNSWDIAGAASYGFTSVWINRYERTPEHLPYKADHVIKNLAELLSLE